MKLFCRTIMLCIVFSCGIVRAQEAAGVVAVDDAVTATKAETTLYPLANDISSSGAELTISGVSNPSVIIRGRTLIVPAGVIGTFTYTITDGASSATGNVNVIAETPIPRPRRWQGLLYDANGKPAGLMQMGRAGVRMIGSINLGDTGAIVRFPTLTASNLRTKIGRISVKTDTNGRLKVTLVNGGNTYTASLRPVARSAAAVQYNLALTGADRAKVTGGGYLRILVSPAARVYIGGRLPDGRPIIRTTLLLDNGTFVFYGPVTHTDPKAILVGEFVTANLTTTDITGEFTWRMEPQSDGLNGDGIDTTLTANGCFYSPTAPLPNGPVQIRFAGADLAAPFTIDRTATNGVPEFDDQIPNWIATVSKGTWAAYVKHPDIFRPVRAFGVYLQKTNTAWGWLPGINVGGSVEMTVKTAAE